jgi:hypothetical protein
LKKGLRERLRVHQRPNCLIERNRGLVQPPNGAQSCGIQRLADPQAVEAATGRASVSEPARLPWAPVRVRVCCRLDQCAGRAQEDREVIMRVGLAIVAALLALPGLAGDIEWLEIGADTEARYYINPGSIQVEGDTIRLQKRQVFNSPLVDNFTGRRVLFKESIGIVELDCGRHINRVTQIDMIGMDGEVVWSSGKLKQRMWEEVKDNTHGGATFEYVCRGLKPS